MNLPSGFEIIGQIIAYGGGGATVAYLLFQYFGKKWIESKFSERLEQMRHDQALELQRLKVEIDSLLSGTIKLQDREFELLPGVWEKLYFAYREINMLVSPMQSYADVDRMAEDQLIEYLETTEFAEYQKNEIINSHNKGEVFRETSFWHRLHKVKVVFVDFQSYVDRNGIFFENELRNKFSTVLDIMNDAITTNEIGHEVSDHKMKVESWKRIKDDFKPIYDDIEKHIHNRLQSHGG